MKQLDDYEVLDIALACGFKLQQQDDKSFSLDRKVWDFAEMIQRRVIQQ